MSGTDVFFEELTKYFHSQYDFFKDNPWFDGLEYHITENFHFTEGDSILDAAMEAGADVPFSCKGGVCCVCKAKIIEGSVFMKQNFSLSDEEVDQGFILTCQSHPESDVVIIDFDEI